MARRLLPLVAALITLVSACGKDSPTNPTPAVETRIIALSSPDMNFGIVDVGQSSDRELLVRNDGNAPLTTTGLTGPAGTEGVFIVSGANVTIQPGATRSIGIRFAPTEQRDYSGVFTVNGNQTAGSNTHTFSASGKRSGPL